MLVMEQFGSQTTISKQNKQTNKKIHGQHVLAQTW